MDQPDVAWLDDERVLEPVDPREPLSELEAVPIVRDARGRLWKVRHRPRAWNSSAALAAIVLAMLVILLVLSVWG